MLVVKLEDFTVRITAEDLVVSIKYPAQFMAANAYSFIWECCERFNKEPQLETHIIPKIYAYGEIMTWPQYVKRLCLTANKLGAKINIKSIE